MCFLLTIFQGTSRVRVNLSSNAQLFFQYTCFFFVRFQYTCLSSEKGVTTSLAQSRVCTVFLFRSSL
ncbi:hypothetical protein RJT34_13977 [Clitoria ternatea]|uniref:Uncharacterized protein n=1 Tax=Clitoria ternatea TaxID=43366 RepID=A0AAN9PMB8_CLITE